MFQEDCLNSPLCCSEHNIPTLDDGNPMLPLPILQSGIHRHLLAVSRLQVKKHPPPSLRCSDKPRLNLWILQSQDKSAIALCDDPAQPVDLCAKPLNGGIIEMNEDAHHAVLRLPTRIHFSGQSFPESLVGKPGAYPHPVCLTAPGINRSQPEAFFINSTQGALIPPFGIAVARVLLQSRLILYQRLVNVAAIGGIQTLVQSRRSGSRA